MERQRDEQVARRPGDVEEEADPVLEAARAQPLAQRDQVVIVDPDDVVGLDQRGDRLGETLVDPLVALAGLALVFGQVDAVVEQRPQRRIGIAVVILLDVLRLEVDRRDGDAVVLLISDLAGEFGHLFARPAEPDALLLAQRGAERPGKPALRARRPAGLGHRDTIRDYHKTAQRMVFHDFDSRPRAIDHAHQRIGLREVAPQLVDAEIEVLGQQPGAWCGATASR